LHSKGKLSSNLLEQVVPLLQAVAKNIDIFGAVKALINKSFGSSFRHNFIILQLLLIRFKYFRHQIDNFGVHHQLNYIFKQGSKIYRG
jgi:hypothetical protein